MRVTIAGCMAALALALSPTTASARLVFERDSTVFVASDRGDSVRRLVAGIRPLPSPDAKWVAYVRVRSSPEGDRSRLLVRRLSGRGSERMLMRDAVPDAWDMRSRRLAVDIDAYYAVVDFGKRSRRVAGAYWHCGAAFAPDGRLAVSDCNDVLVLGRHLGPFNGRSVGGNAEPVWGRGGLAFAAIDVTTREGPRGPSTLYLIPPGGRRQTLFSGDGSIAPVAWSADGRRLLVNRETGPVLVEPATGGYRRLASTGGALDLNPAGTHALVRERDGLHVVGLDGTNVLVVPGGSDGRWVRPLPHASR